VDWAESEELMAIYLEEVDERAKDLVAGGSALRSGRVPPDRLVELVRHAHTLKGSSHMIGKLDVGAAAAALERAWKKVHAAGGAAPEAVAEVMIDVARLLPAAARHPSERGRLGDLTTQLSEYVDRTSPPPPPVSGGSGLPAAATPEPETATGDDGPDLGGLLASIDTEVGGSVTRIDTGDLYRLINRAVEIGLDAEALADLTHVVVDGGDPIRVVSAWRTQLERLGADVAELQQWAVNLANGEFSEAVEAFPQFVRFLGRRLGKEIHLEIDGEKVAVDRQVVDLLREPLRHIIVNAIDHGIQSPAERVAAGKPPAGTIRLVANLAGDRLVVSVADDGCGVDWQAVAAAAQERGWGTSQSELRGHLFRPGFTTVGEPGDFSGTGEGLAVVADTVDDLGGSVSLESRPGAGTVVRLDLPVSLVLQNVVIVSAGDQFFGIAEPAVLESISLDSTSTRFSSRGRELLYLGEPIPVVSFCRELGIPEPRPETMALILATRAGNVAVAVPEVVQQRRVAVKSLGPILEDNDHLTGAAFLGNGDLLAIVDHHHLGERARRPGSETDGIKARVLVVDDSAGVRQLIAATLRGRGYEVALAPNAHEAVRSMARRPYDALVVDYSMPRSSGVELVRALRHAGVTVPIVMVSGVASEEDKAAAWEAGVDAYLDKYDVRRGALTTSIQRLLQERSTLRR
jgi:chemotaxis protein histidine kinase CheA/methylmalonyl-CoA mutase cobalamin-binding subunit